MTFQEPCGSGALGRSRDASMFAGNLVRDRADDLEAHAGLHSSRSGYILVFTDSGSRDGSSGVRGSPRALFYIWGSNAS